jgi:hypothetical protein
VSSCLPSSPAFVSQRSSQQNDNSKGACECNRRARQGVFKEYLEWYRQTDRLAVLVVLFCPLEVLRPLVATGREILGNTEFLVPSVPCAISSRAAATVKQGAPRYHQANQNGQNKTKSTLEIFWHFAICFALPA